MRLTLEQAEDILDKTRAEAIAATEKEARPITDEILAHIDEIKGKAGEIGEKDIPEGLSERVVKIIEAAKPAFVENVTGSFKGVESGPEGGLVAGQAFGLQHF